MNKLSRKMFRNSAKEAYKKYCVEFSRIKGVQSQMTKAARIREIEAGRPMLGRRLTFKEWLAAVRRVEAFKADPETVQEHVESLEWDE